ncbi:hypothetical protein E4U31_007246 [Claviceps sp. LM219 group G6]|nr:hypothetical protein E4U31_007246 [Claviceps sp. LM219 group G6]
MTGTNLRAWIFDRSGAYSGTKFNIHKNPERFFRMLCGYVMMSDDELGLDTFTQHKDGKMVVTMPADICKSELTEIELHSEPIAHQRAIVCRATTCFTHPVSNVLGICDDDTRVQGCAIGNAATDISGEDFTLGLPNVAVSRERGATVQGILFDAPLTCHTS